MRLPETVQTLYAELLDQVRAADVETAIGGRSGSFVSKNIRGATYWYLQQSAGGRKRQIYIGRDTPELRQRLRLEGEQRSAIAADERHRRDLIAMLAAGGMSRESAAVGAVLQILADAGVFRAGGVLIGTQAFSCLANMLGVKFEEGSLRTADIDVAIDITTGRTAKPSFLTVPGLDPRKPSTSFKVRGREVRVNFLIPGRRTGSRPVTVSHLGIAAQPLVGLDYLVDDRVDAAVLAAAGIHANVPAPARFALHQLSVGSRQAAHLLDVLLNDRPDDVQAAWDALASRPGMLRKVQRALSAPLRDRLRAVTR